MASYMLFETLSRLTDKRDTLNHDEKAWLIDIINNKLNIEGKEKLYSLLVVYNKQADIIYDPKEPFYDIEQIHPKLQLVWFEFTKMYLKSQTVGQKKKTTINF